MNNSSSRRSKKMSCLVAKAPNTQQEDLSMPVELVDKSIVKDENVDADQTRTGRPVGGQQYTQLEEIDIAFRVPGLSRAVVKEAEKLPLSRTRE